MIRIVIAKRTSNDVRGITWLNLKMSKWSKLGMERVILKRKQFLNASGLWILKGQLQDQKAARN